MKTIKGYHYGDESLPPSPVSLEDLDLLKQSLLWSKEDNERLKLAWNILEPQTEDILDVWYAYVGSHPFLIHYFGDENGTPNANYLSSVRKRFGQWIGDLCTRDYDQSWLNYQHEVALRHLTKKNQTDGVESVPFVHFRYMIAFIYPITVTIKPFLQKGEVSKETVDGMHNAWFKAVTLSALLWCYPYINPGQF